MIISPTIQISSPLPSRSAKTKSPAAAETPEASPARPASISAAAAPLQDADAARAALQTAKQQFMAQPNVAMLAQANQLPQNALRLLQ